MSRVYFHAKGQERAEIYGSERVYLMGILGRLLVNSLDLSINPFPFKDHLLASFAPNYVDTNEKAQWFFSSLMGCTEIAGYDSVQLQMNTALSMGSDPIRLAAFVAYGCEQHHYFDPRDFKWLKRAIKLGLSTGIYRKDTGWDQVVSLIDRAKKASSPIVMSFSVCNEFPGRKEWDEAFKEIEDEFRLSPSISSVGHGLNGWQLMQYLHSMKSKGNQGAR